MQVELGNLHNTSTVVRKPQLEKNFETLQNEVESLGKATSNVTKKNITKLLKDINNNKSSLNGVNLVTGETHYQVLLNNLYSAVEQPHIGADNNNLLEMIKKDLDTSHSNYFIKVKEAEEYYKSNPVGKSVISNKTTPKITVFGKELELKPTVTDGNCGVDAIKQLTGDSRELPVIRKDIALKCDSAREFCTLAGSTKVENIEVQQQNILKLLEPCYKDFATFKKVFIKLSQEKRDNIDKHSVKLTECLNKSHDWFTFQSDFKNAKTSEARIQILSSIMSQMPLLFDGELSLLNGVGRNNIGSGDYKDMLEDNQNKIWLDFQEIKLYLSSQGFIFNSSQDLATPKGVAFKFVDSENKEIILFLNNIQLKNGQHLILQSERSNHWRYLVPVQA